MPDVRVIDHEVLKADLRRRIRATSTCSSASTPSAGSVRSSGCARAAGALTNALFPARRSPGSFPSGSAPSLRRRRRKLLSAG